MFGSSRMSSGRSARPMQDYLTWEVNLVEQIQRDGDARFRFSAGQ
jgi:hypothetical protein